MYRRSVTHLVIWTTACGSAVRLVCFALKKWLLSKSPVSDGVQRNCGPPTCGAPWCHSEMFWHELIKNKYCHTVDLHLSAPGQSYPFSQLQNCKAIHILLKPTTTTNDLRFLPEDLGSTLCDSVHSGQRAPSFAGYMTSLDGDNRV